jgi:hypothetical protein
VKGKIVFVLVATLLIFALGIQPGVSKEEDAAVPDSAKIVRRLNEILANQAEILKQFSEVKQELAVIKIRATR